MPEFYASRPKSWKAEENDSIFEQDPITRAKNVQDFLREVEMTLSERGLDYGNADASFQRIADVWSFLKIDVISEKLTPQDVASMMIAMKLCRLETTPNHRDSWIDIAGYACLAACMEKENA